MSMHTYYYAGEKKMNKPISRRAFVKAGVAAFAAGPVLTAANAAESSKAKKNTKPVRFAFIGVGARGTHHLKNLLNFPGIEVKAICDIV